MNVYFKDYKCNKYKFFALVIFVVITLAMNSFILISCQKQSKQVPKSSENMVETVNESKTETPVSSSNFINSPWPMFGHDEKHTCRTTLEGPNKPSLKWKFDLGGPDSFSEPIISADGIIYYGTCFGKFYAILPNGKMKWEIQVGPNNSSNYVGYSLIGPDDMIYVTATRYGDLYAVDSNGNEKWHFNLGKDYNISAPVFDGSDGLRFGGNDYYYYSLSAEWGTIGNKIKADGKYVSSPAIDGPNVYFTSDSYLYACRLGELKWKFKTNSSIVGSPSISSDGTINIASGDGCLYAVNPDGTLKWRLKISNKRICSLPAIANDGTIYIGSTDSYLYAISSNGKLKWKFKTNGEINSSPAVDSKDVVYFSSDDSYLYAVNPNGTLKWKFKTDDNACRLSSPAIGKNKIIYIVSGQYLYAIGGNT